MQCIMCLNYLIIYLLNEYRSEVPLGRKNIKVLLLTAFLFFYQV